MGGKHCVLATAGALSILSMVATSAAQTPLKSPGFPAGAMGEKLQDYVNALNRADPALARHFASDDLSPNFPEPHPPAALEAYFQSQHRLTGGITPIGFRFDTGSKTQGQLAFRDAIYRSSRAIAVSFDDTPGRKILNLAPSPTPEWAVGHQKRRPVPQVSAYAAALLQRGCSAGAFSGAFLVAHGSRILVQQACGEARRSDHTQNTANTRFNIGSMNKMFTATATLQLVEKGRLALKDRLSAYVDETWIPRAISDEITVEQLLTMTSGLGSYFDDVPIDHFRMNRTLNAYKPMIQAQPAKAKPGEKFIYSDTGFFLLGLVVQKASGEDYYDYIRRHIYVPAGMASTDSFELGNTADGLATGYTFRGGPDPWRENSEIIPFKGGPDGGGYSTVGDLYRFAEALRAGKLLSQKSLDLLWTDHRPNNWGMGFDVYASPAGRIVGKDGFAPGVSSEMDIYLDRDYVVVALANYDAAGKPPVEAMRAELSGGSSR